MKRLFLSLLVALALSVSAFAMEVPTDTVVQNLNGSQQLIKTYTLPPGSDPQALIEEPFHLEGYVYTFADIVKAENHVSDKDSPMETVTLETSTAPRLPATPPGAALSPPPRPSARWTATTCPTSPPPRSRMA